jgi:hypothetical protein
MRHSRCCSRARLEWEPPRRYPAFAPARSPHPARLSRPPRRRRSIALKWTFSCAPDRIKNANCVVHKECQCHEDSKRSSRPSIRLRSLGFLNLVPNPWHPFPETPPSGRCSPLTCDFPLFVLSGHFLAVRAGVRQDTDRNVTSPAQGTSENEARSVVTGVVCPSWTVFWTGGGVVFLKSARGGGECHAGTR